MVDQISIVGHLQREEPNFVNSNLTDFKITSVFSIHDHIKRVDTTLTDHEELLPDMKEDSLLLKKSQYYDTIDDLEIGIESSDDEIDQHLLYRWPVYSEDSQKMLRVPDTILPFVNFFNRYMATALKIVCNDITTFTKSNVQPSILRKSRSKAWRVKKKIRNIKIEHSYAEVAVCQGSFFVKNANNEETKQDLAKKQNENKHALRRSQRRRIKKTIDVAKRILVKQQEQLNTKKRKRKLLHKKVKFKTTKTELKESNEKVRLKGGKIIKIKDRFGAVHWTREETKGDRALHNNKEKFRRTELRHLMENLAVKVGLERKAFKINVMQKAVTFIVDLQNTETKLLKLIKKLTKTRNRLSLKLREVVVVKGLNATNHLPTGNCLSTGYGENQIKNKPPLLPTFKPNKSCVSV